MNGYVVRRRGLAVAGLGIAVLLTACEDKRLKQLNVGITRDSAMTIVGQSLKGGKSDSFPNVYTRERFLTNGKNYEVLYYTPDNDKIGPRPRSKGADSAHTDTAHVDSVPWKRLTPLVFLDNKLVSKTWNSWDSLSKALNIVPKKHDK